MLVILQDNYNPIRIIMTAAHIHDPDFINKCLMGAYNEKLCEAAFAYSQFKENLMTTITLWFCFLIVVSVAVVKRGDSD